MKIAYLILAHSNPGVLERSIARLSSADSDIYIHVDKKCKMDVFERIHADRAYFCKERVPVYWGEFSQVEAILLLLRTALASPKNSDYFVLISGADYPLRSGAYIQKFLDSNRGLEFMNLVRVPAPGKPLSRIDTLRFPHCKPIRHFAFRALAKVGLARRNHRDQLKGLEPYSGSTWWALSRNACQYLLEFIDQNPHVVQYFENVFAADEAFLHTILGNSQFKSHIRHNLLFEDWSAEGSHPAFISSLHVTHFKKESKVTVKDSYGSGEVLFARKFRDADINLLRQIDEIAAEKEGNITSV